MDPSWYPAWLGCGFTDQEIAEWYPTTSSCRTGSPAAAVRLTAARWTPTDFRAAILAVETGRAYCTAADIDRATREAVLWHEVSAHYRARAVRAEQVRGSALSAARALGASHETLGRRLGMAAKIVASLIAGSWPGGRP